MSEPEPKPREPGSAPSLWQVLQSVNAAFFGVQSSKNRERDFKQGKASHYIVVGLIMTVVFILLMVGVVKLVLRGAGL